MVKEAHVSNTYHSLERLYEEYHPPILAYLTRLVQDRPLAEDLCQDTFVKALRAWGRRDPEGSVVSWLYRIATNTAYDHLRRRRRVHMVPLPQVDLCPQPSEFEARIEAGEPMQVALAQVGARYREPLVLHVCAGLSMAEIADRLGCSTGAVKMRVFRARERLREVYCG
jgi:RNA polymerase sigma-70 factor (ECF subfamily)